MSGRRKGLVRSLGRDFGVAASSGGRAWRTVGRREESRRGRERARGACARPCSWADTRMVFTCGLCGALDAGLLAGVAADAALELALDVLEPLSVATLAAWDGRRPSGST